MTTALQKKIEGFAWEVVTDATKFKGALGCFKILAKDRTDLDDIADLKWPPPSKFLKDKKLKERVWSDIEESVVPALRRQVVQTGPLNISDHQLQKLLQRVSESDVSFELDHPDGFTIGVNKTTGVDLSVSSADIASMLGATWLFGAKAIRLHSASNQGKELVE